MRRARPGPRVLGPGLRDSPPDALLSDAVLNGAGRPAGLGSFPGPPVPCGGDTLAVGGGSCPATATAEHLSLRNSPHHGNGDSVSHQRVTSVRTRQQQSV